MRVTCERCFRCYEVHDATVRGRQIRARCRCGARVLVKESEGGSGCRSLVSTGSSTDALRSPAQSGRRPVRWFVDATDGEPIEMDLRQLVRGFDADRIDEDTLIWRTGMPTWRRLGDVPELADFLLGESPPASEPAPSSAPASAVARLAPHDEQPAPPSSARPSSARPSSTIAVAPEPAAEERECSARAVLIAIGAVLSVRASFRALRAQNEAEGDLDDGKPDPD